MFSFCPTVKYLLIRESMNCFMTSSLTVETLHLVGHQNAYTCSHTIRSRGGPLPHKRVVEDIFVRK